MKKQISVSPRTRRNTSFLGRMMTSSLRSLYIGKSDTKLVVTDYAKLTGTRPSPNTVEILERVFDFTIPQTLKTYPTILQSTTIEDVFLLEPTLLKVLAVYVGDRPYCAQEQTDTCIQLYQGLYQSLLMTGSPEWLRLQPRSDKLFKWCAVIIDDLVITPLLALIPDEPAREQARETVLSLVMNIVHFDTMIDDLADVLHDKPLIEVCQKIPKASSEDLERLQVEVAEYKEGIFSDFFKGIVSLWQTTQSQLDAINPGLRETDLYQKFMGDMDKLMGAMSFSVALNQERKLRDFDTMKEKLSSNMMVEIIFDLLRLVLKTHKIELDPNLVPSFEKFEKTLQGLFRLCNNIATREREVGERDMSNLVFVIADARLKADYQVWLTTHAGRSFENYIRSEAVANGESPHFKGSCFSELFSLENQEAMSGHINIILKILAEKNMLGVLENITDVHDFSIKVRLLLTPEGALDSGAKERVEKELVAIDGLQKIEDQNTKILRRLLLNESVMEDFYQYWLEETQALNLVIAEFNGIVDTLPGDNACWKSSMAQFKEKNVLFLLSYLIFSGIKGAT